MTKNPHNCCGQLQAAGDVISGQDVLNFKDASSSICREKKTLFEYYSSGCGSGDGIAFRLIISSAEFHLAERTLLHCHAPDKTLFNLSERPVRVRQFVSRPI